MLSSSWWDDVGVRPSTTLYTKGIIQIHHESALENPPLVRFLTQWKQVPPHFAMG